MSPSPEVCLQDMGHDSIKNEKKRKEKKKSRSAYSKHC